MFYYINGKLTCLTASFAVVDVSGVGYKMTITQTTRSALPSLTNGSESPTVKLFCYMAVREDDIELFGFETEEELFYFKLLTTVSGVGPKAAVSILSELTPSKLAFAICNDDKKSIAKASGVGPKTAARIILELKDKLKRESSASVFDDNEPGLSMPSTAASDKERDALEALTVLGYGKSDVAKILKSIDIANTELDDIIRLALKKLM